LNRVNNVLHDFAERERRFGLSAYECPPNGATDQKQTLKKLRVTQYSGMERSSMSFQIEVIRLPSPRFERRRTVRQLTENHDKRIAAVTEVDFKQTFFGRFGQSSSARLTVPHESLLMG